MAKKPTLDDKRFALSLTGSGANGEPPIAVLMIPQAAWEEMHRAGGSWISLDPLYKVRASTLLVGRCTTYAEGMKVGALMGKAEYLDAAHATLRSAERSAAEAGDDPTPPSPLRALGRLQVARRHVDRLRRGVLPVSDAVLDETQRSIEETLDIIQALT